MQSLINGIQRFQDEVYSSKQVLFQRIRSGQSPSTLFITCSDSRIDPALLTQTEPGELFVLRNAGNIVPPFRSRLSGAEDMCLAATIEYAVSELKVSDIIICGHSHCAAMTGLLDPQQLADLPAVRRWLGYTNVDYRLAELDRDEVHDPNDRLDAVVEENVLCQMSNLMTHPCVARAVAANALKVYGWTYRLETAEVLACKWATSEFVPIAQFVPDDHCRKMRAA